MSRKDKEPNKQLKECVLGWIEKLSTHFNQPQDEEQIKIFLHALRNCTTYQVDIAFERCLNELSFVPKLSEVHARMPEQRWPAENPTAFITYGPPTLELVRPYAEKICKEMTGREYNELDTYQDAELIKKVFAEATTLRYICKGVTGKWLKPTAEQQAEAARLRAKYPELGG